LREIKIRRNTGGGFERLSHRITESLSHRNTENLSHRNTENLSHRIFDAYAALSHRNSETPKPLSEALEDSNAHGHINPLSEALEDSGSNQLH